MLLSYRFENFGVFKEKVEFSMNSGLKMARYTDNEIEFNNKFRVLKSAVMIGENGGGKTTFIRSLEQFQSLLRASDKSLAAVPHTMNHYLEDVPDAEQGYELEVLLPARGRGGKQEFFIYRYTLNLDRYGITREHLDRRTIKTQAVDDIFSIRCKTTEVDVQDHPSMQDVGFGLNLMHVPENLGYQSFMIDCRMGTGLNRLASFSSDVILPFAQWVRDSLVVKHRPELDRSAHTSYTNEIEETVHILNSPQFLELMRLADSTIIEIHVDKNEPYKNTKLIRMTEHGEKFSMALSNESEGIREFFYWAEQIWKVLYENKTLFVDNFDRLFDPVLTAKLIAFVNKTDHKGQFIFTTHNALHLNFQDFRKEQIWIASKRETPFSSELYSVADFKGMQYSNIHLWRGYLQGALNLNL